MQAVKRNVYNLQYRPHRPVITKRRLVWRPITRVQEWLESEDKLPSKLVAYVLLVVTAVFLVSQIVRWII